MRMTKYITSLLVALVGVALLLWAPTNYSTQAESSESKQGIVLTVNGAISPAVADYLVRGIAKANKEQAVLIVIHMDTPGGLDKSMRSIIKAIIASGVPIANYVAPSGARAASAGTYISYASHIAAMAPLPNICLWASVSVFISDWVKPLREQLC